MRDAQSVLAEPLCFLINDFISFSTKLSLCFQLTSKKLCSHLYIKRKQEDPNTHRPISETGALAKIFEQVTMNQNNDYLFSNSFLSTKQFGYRKKMSTADALLQCTE